MRSRRGLTQRQLAERLGFNENQIAGLESGDLAAQPGLRRLLMGYFGCEFHDLFEVILVTPEA